MLDSLVNRLCSCTTNCIIIGDNATGKTELLNRIAGCSEPGGYLFIESDNRAFYGIDTCTGKVKEHLESIFYDFFSTRLSGIVSMNTEYQAILCIFKELFNADGVRTVLIDDIDLHLSPRSIHRLFDIIFGMKALRFIVTIHSLAYVGEIGYANVILLERSSYKKYEVHEGEAVNDLVLDNHTVEPKEDTQRAEYTSTLRTLLNLRIADKWDETAQKILDDLDVNDLTANQKMLYKSIAEW